jgi:RNA polymerase sigma-70 factor (ECF subfamily)
LEAVRELNREALIETFDLYSNALYRYAIRLCNDPSLADQLVGDVFARLLDHLSVGGGPRTNLRSYLYEMVYHAVLDEARYAKRRVALKYADSSQQNATTSVIQFTEDELLLERLQFIMGRDLTEDQRHVIILRFMEEFSLRETAVIMGKTVNSIKVTEHRALVKIRKAMDSVTSEIQSPAFAG